jgi:hypothetical protein
MNDMRLKETKSNKDIFNSFSVSLSRFNNRSLYYHHLLDESSSYNKEETSRQVHIKLNASK